MEWSSYMLGVRGISSATKDNTCSKYIQVVEESILSIFKYHLDEHWNHQDKEDNGLCR